MKEWNELTIDGIKCLDFGVFVVVTSLASQSQIIERIFASSTKRMNMLNREWVGCITSLALTVFTASLSTMNNSLFQSRVHSLCIGWLNAEFIQKFWQRNFSNTCKFGEIFQPFCLMFFNLICQVK